MHSLATVLVTWVLLAVVPRPWVGTASFLFNMGYLVVIYVKRASESGYDIDMTMPQCVLAMRLAGLAYDYSDGALPEGALSDYTRANRITARPSLVELLGYSYHWAGVIVGPQYSLATYRRFVDGKELARAPSSAWPALQTLIAGALYLGLHVYLSGLMPFEVVLADVYGTWPLWRRVVYLVLSLRLVLMRYGGIWLVNDGHCILSGLGYAGTDKIGQHHWNRVSNFLPLQFETATSIAGYVGAFNVNTNHWVREYVFKRLRFLNNRHLSSIGALAFLAIWHGVAAGYFICFGLEFVDGIAEAAFLRLLAPVSAYAAKHPALRAVMWFAGYVINLCMLSFGLSSFILKRYDLSILVHERLAWLGIIVPVAIIAVDAVVGLARPRRAPKGKAE